MKEERALKMTSSGDVKKIQLQDVVNLNVLEIISNIDDELGRNCIIGCIQKYQKYLGMIAWNIGEERG